MSAVPPQHWTIEIACLGAKFLLFVVIATKIIYLYAYAKLLKFIEEEEFQRNIKNENYRPDQQWDQIQKLTKEVKKTRRKRIGLLTRLLRENEEMERKHKEAIEQQNLSMWQVNPKAALEKLTESDENDQPEKVYENEKNNDDMENKSDDDDGNDNDDYDDDDDDNGDDDGYAEHKRDYEDDDDNEDDDE